jgi:hypothetical protein
MVITRDQVEERLAALRVGLARLQSDAVATEGGIKDCEYWLSVLDALAGVEAPASGDNEAPSS